MFSGINISVANGLSTNKPIKSWLVPTKQLKFYIQLRGPIAFNDSLSSSVLFDSHPIYTWRGSNISGECCITNNNNSPATAQLELFPSLASAIHPKSNQTVYRETITVSTNSTMCFKEWGPGKSFAVKEEGYYFFLLSVSENIKYTFKMNISQVYVNESDYSDPQYFTSSNHSYYMYDKCFKNDITQSRISYVSLCLASADDVETDYLMIHSCPLQLNSTILWLVLMIALVVSALIIVGLTVVIIACFCQKKKPWERLTTPTQAHNDQERDSLIS